MSIGVNNVEKANNVGVVHLLQQRDFSNSGAGNSFILGLKTDLLESDDSALIIEVSSLVDDPVGSYMRLSIGEWQWQLQLQLQRWCLLTFSNLFQFLIVLHGERRGDSNAKECLEGM